MIIASAIKLTSGEIYVGKRQRSNATRGINNPRCVKLLCIETGIVYPSIDEASKSAYLDSKYRSRISTSIKEGRPVKGFSWKRL